MKTALVVSCGVCCGAVAAAEPEAGQPTEAEVMKPWKEIDLGEYGKTFPCPGDLDGDGRVDFLLFRQGPQTAPGYLIAVDHDGRKLWSMGDSSIAGHMPDGHYKEPALRGIALVYDIDEDGRSEVIAELWEDNRPMLYVLDGATGRVERVRESPLDLKVRGGKRSRCHPVARIAHLNGNDGPPAVVLKYGASGHVPALGVALDGSLKTLWEVSAEGKAVGHVPSVGDVDGDGRDEIMFGTLLVDDDGATLWQKEARNHADCTAVFEPSSGSGKAVLVSICNTGPAFCLSPSGQTIWEKTTKEVSHGQGIWAGDFIADSAGKEVIILKSGHQGDFMTVTAAGGEPLAAFQHRGVLRGYPDFPCVVNWLGGGADSLWIPIDRCLVDGRGEVVAELGPHEEHVRKRLDWGTTKRHVATQAFALDLCGDQREELVLYQPYNGQAILVFTQPDSDGRRKPYVPQPAAYNIRSYF